VAFTTALLDANVLHPMVLCDLLIRLAQRGLYRALWTREILAEVVATVLRRRPDLSAELLQKRTAAMQAALQDATIEGYEALVPSLPELGADAHVAAAALFGQADVIVTSNIRDFPEHVLDRYGIAALLPDDFLGLQWWVDPAAVAETLVQQAYGAATADAGGHPHTPPVHGAFFREDGARVRGVPLRAEVTDLRPEQCGYRGLQCGVGAGPT
jgi:hypothetical protein